MTVWTEDEQREHRSEWVKALRSGKYKQGIGQLRTFEDEYCCLGVACELMREKYPSSLILDKEIEEECYSYSGALGLIPENVAAYYGISTWGEYGKILIDSKCGEYAYCTSLVENNDDDKLSFEKIADIIDKYF